MKSDDLYQFHCINKLVITSVYKKQIDGRSESCQKVHQLLTLPTEACKYAVQSFEKTMTLWFFIFLHGSKMADDAQADSKKECGCHYGSPQSPLKWRQVAAPV